VSAAEIHVLFFGDSHTLGVGDPSGLGWAGLGGWSPRLTRRGFHSLPTTSAFAARHREMFFGDGKERRRFVPIQLTPGSSSQLARTTPPRRTALSRRRLALCASRDSAAGGGPGGGPHKKKKKSAGG
jgi:hypothetical protein